MKRGRPATRCVLGIPMEPVSYPGRRSGAGRAADARYRPQQNIERLQKVLGRVTGYVGVMNSMGSKFTASTTALTPVMQDLSHRGLLFVDSSATRLSVAAKIARIDGHPARDQQPLYRQ